MLKRLYRYLFAPKSPSVKALPVDKYEPAFTIKGRKFFRMIGNLTDYPILRASAALTIYEEFNCRMTRDLLEQTLKAVLEKLTPTGLNSKGFKVDLNGATQLISNALDNLQGIPPAELAYKIAAVIYFEETEDIGGAYNFHYAQEKIDFFKANKLEDFFFQEPLNQYLPDLPSLGLDSDTWEGASAVKQLQLWMPILQQLSQLSTINKLPDSSRLEILSLLKSLPPDSLLSTNIMNLLNN